MEERLAEWLVEESYSFEGDDDTDPDYVVPLEDAASDAETNIVIETEGPYDDDDDLKYFYEGAAAATKALNAVNMD